MDMYFIEKNILFSRLLILLTHSINLSRLFHVDFQENPAGAIYLIIENLIWYTQGVYRMLRKLQRVFVDYVLKFFRYNSL